MLIFSTSLVLITVGAFVQNSHFILWGVKPNLVLTAIVALSLFEKDWLRRSLATLLGTALLILELTFGFDTVFLLVLFFAAMASVDLLPWRPLLNGTVALTAATLIINLSGFQLGVFVLELIYNLVLLLALFAMFNSWNTRRI
ncbi:MAG: hypothetical protein Q8P99_01480 [bacterium]|nr:hypothetical protein [bacterium]MDZ4231577.1 hypothetical protein [Patescibacteria group bacterium]